jgi:DNA end-binding protein Ku
MPRALWKGAINFGLVHVPVTLYPASKESGIDFDWLDARSMDPVGYKRINKRSGKEIAAEHIVRGVKHGDGQYVVLSDDEIKAAYPRTTQTIELESFAKASEIPFVYLDRPYFLEPHGRGDKVYALLRDALAASGRIGIGRVVIAAREHLCALIPDGPLLMLDTLRWADEIRPADELELPPVGAGVRDSEMKMARQLIDEMTAPWDPSQHRDRFRAAVMALVDQKAEKGQVEQVEPVDDEAATLSKGNVVDLSELLKRSLGGARPQAKPARAKKAAATKAAATKATSTKRTQASKAEAAAPKARRRA